MKTLSANSLVCMVNEFIFYPLLTATAFFMGTNAFVNINPEWQEPSILWFIIAARKREKKTAALKRIRKPIEELETELRLEWQRNMDQSKPSVPPQLIVDYFSFEELHSILAQNNGQVLGCFDEMSSFYGQLDLFKHMGSTIDRKTLLTLVGRGHAISRTTQQQLKKLHSTSLVSFSLHLFTKCFTPVYHASGEPQYTHTS